jgi:hypothetical protein
MAWQIPKPASSLVVANATSCVGDVEEAETSQMPVLVQAKSRLEVPFAALPMYGMSVRTSLVRPPVSPVHHSRSPRRLRRPCSPAMRLKHRRQSPSGSMWPGEMVFSPPDGPGR